MMKKDRISIIIPVYNAEKYLHECLDSVLAQTYENIEVICVDDGSTDDSWKILQDYAGHDERIRLLRQKNQYAGVARNNGFDQATGKYVCFWDADDVFLPDMIEKMTDRIKETDADIAICKWEILDNITCMKHIPSPEPLSDIPDKDTFSKDDIPDGIFQITNTWVWEKLYRADFLRKKNIRFQDTKIINDALFCCVAYAEAKRITAVKEVLVKHRMNNPQSTEYTRAAEWRYAFGMFDCLYRELKNRGMEDIRKSFINLEAHRIVNYVFNISDAGFFSEAYSYYNNIARYKYKLLSYPKEFFDEERTYERLKMLETLNEAEYFAAMYKEKTDEVMDRIRDIWNLENANSNLENANSYLEKACREMGTLLDIWNKEKRWYFDEEAYPSGTRYVIYGYGKVGRHYAAQLHNSKHSELVTIIDKNWNKLETKDIQILGLDKIDEIFFDYVIVSIRDEETAKQAIKDIVGCGVSRDKVICPSLEKKVR